MEPLQEICLVPDTANFPANVCMIPLFGLTTLMRVPSTKYMLSSLSNAIPLGLVSVALVARLPSPQLSVEHKQWFCQTQKLVKRISHYYESFRKSLHFNSCDMTNFRQKYPLFAFNWSHVQYIFLNILFILIYGIAT